MSNLDQDLGRRIQDLREQGLYRELRPAESAKGGRITTPAGTLLNFSSNDYLGLADHPALKEAGIRAVERYGTGSGASRLICGSLAPHLNLEKTLAEFKRTEAALSFSSGYAAAVGTICALLEKDDILILDRLVHACIVDAGRLCGAKLRVFPHNDLNRLEAILKWACALSGGGGSATRRRRILIVTESVFSMDGDHAPLRELAALKEKYGAWLMLDEAHATGLYGPERRGLAEAEEVSGLIEIQMGTLGKAAGAAGGYICGSRTLIDFLINRARSFIFSTAPPPATAAAAEQGIRLIAAEEGANRCRTLWQNVAQVRQGLAPAALPESPPGAIIPIPAGPEDRALKMAAALRERGIFIPAIRYPTVARGAARLRLTLSAAHSAGDITELLAALSQVCRSFPNTTSRPLSHASTG